MSNLSSTAQPNRSNVLNTSETTGRKASGRWEQPHKILTLETSNYLGNVGGFLNKGINLSFNNSFEDGNEDPKVEDEFANTFNPVYSLNLSWNITGI